MCSGTVKVKSVFVFSLFTYYITLGIRIFTFRAEKQSYERFLENKRKAENSLGIISSMHQSQLYPPKPSPVQQQSSPVLQQPPPVIQQSTPSIPSQANSIFCWNCGQANKSINKYCLMCGQDITKSKR